MVRRKKDKTPVIIGVVAGFIASLCCLGPVLLVLFGLGSISFALSIGKYTWLFLSLGIIFLIAALIVYFTKKKSCNIVGFKHHWKTILVTFIIAVLILIIIKYWLATYLAQLVYR